MSNLAHPAAEVWDIQGVDLPTLLGPLGSDVEQEHVECGIGTSCYRDECGRTVALQLSWWHNPAS